MEDLEKLNGRCATCGKKFKEFEDEVMEFCCSKCDEKWHRDNLAGYEDYEVSFYKNTLVEENEDN